VRGLNEIATGSHKILNFLLHEYKIDAERYQIIGSLKVNKCFLLQLSSILL